MITILLNRNKSRQIKEFTVTGHSDYSQRGTDIVCAAVTTAVMTAVNGLTDVAEIAMEPQVREGFVLCQLPDELSDLERHDADIILESMVLSLDDIAEQYPKDVRLKETIF